MVRKKVLAIVEDLPHKGKPYSWGSVAEQLRELSKYCDIKIIVTPQHARSLLKPATQKSKVDELSYSGWLDRMSYYRPRFPIIPYYPYHWYDYSKALAVLTCILRNGIRFDLIHAHYAYRTGYIAALVTKALRKPLVLTVYGSDIHRNTRVGFKPPFWRDRTLRTLEMSNRIIAVSGSLRLQVDELGFGEKTTIISHGFVRQRFKLENRRLYREKIDIPINSRVLLYVGNMLKVKGVDLLPETLKLLCQARDDIMLLMVGRGCLKEELKKEFAERGLMDKVRFVGAVPNTDIGNFMSSADLLVVPSRNEGRPAVVMEALSCGLPGVGTKVGGIPEILVENSLGLLVEPENPKALADGILRAIDCNWNRKHLNKYAQQFTWETIAPQIYQVYLDLTKELG